MKKYISLLCMLLLVLPVCFAAGCSDGDKNNGNVTQTVSEQGIVLCDFERYDPDFMSLQISQDFGIIDVNADAGYVKSGKQSAKLRPYGGKYTGEAPLLTVPFVSVKHEYTYSDLIKYERVGIQMYNAETYGINMYSSFIFGKDASKTVTTVLNPGWNDVKLYTNLDELNIFFDITSSECGGLQLMFDNFANEFESFGETPALYMDDIILYEYDKEFVLADLNATLRLDPYEICGFEKAWQSVAVNGTANSPAASPAINVVGADNGVTPSEGERMLRVTVPVNGDLWPRIHFPSRLSEMVNYYQYVPEENYCLAYDVYNTGSPKNVATYMLGDGINRLGHPNASWSVNMKAYVNSPASGKWVTYRFSLSEIRSGWSLSVWNAGFNFYFLFGDQYDAGGQTFYFDNFRIERVK